MNHSVSPLNCADIHHYPVSSIKSIEEHMEMYSNCFDEKELELILDLINSKEEPNIIIAFEIINQKPETNEDQTIYRY